MSVSVQKEDIDPAAVRVSAGWVRNTADGYVVYRGTLDEAINCLQNVLESMKSIKRTVEHPADCPDCARINNGNKN